MMTARRSRAFALAVSTAALASLWAGAASSQAAFTTPEYQFTFAGAGDHQIGDTRSVAVDQQTHAVYVADRANHRIEKFDALGNFLFMFGDSVNQTTGGDVCPATPGDVCRPGQMSSATYPHWNSPSAVAVDNSNGASKGNVYVADTSEGQVSKFTSSGSLITSWGEGGKLQANPLKMTVSAFTGYLWILDSNWDLVSYDDKGVQDWRQGQEWNPGGGDDMAVDSFDDAYYNSAGGVAVKADVTDENEVRAASLTLYPGGARGWYVNPANSDVLISFGSEVVVLDRTCDPTLGYCAAKDIFGAGNLADSRGLAVDSSTGYVYVADSDGIDYFKPKVIPDVVPTAQPAAGHTDATLFSHLDPLGAGDITECKVEYGSTKNYGSTVPCNQATPISTVKDVTANVAGLTAESTYHYRFLAKNGNGVTKGPDQLVTPHWVKNLVTLDADVNGPGSVVLNGSLDPNGEKTHYYFEWGTTIAYGNKTPSAVGADPGTAPGDTPVEANLDSLVTSETTYHYRLVGYSDLGMSKGVDKTVTTPIAGMPGVKGGTVSGIGPRSATISGEVNPSYGGTSYMVQYGPTSDYGSRTVISESVGDDGVFHPVSAELEELTPGTTYHYRLVALNFRGTTQGGDSTFTTASPPEIVGTTATVLDSASARLDALIVSNGFSGNPTVHFEYGTTAAYGSRTAESAPLGLEGGRLETVLSGLTPDTTYHFRAVSKNAFGSASTPDQSFTTGPAPTVAPLPPPACKKNQVKRKGKCVKKPKPKHRKKRRHGARG